MGFIRELLNEAVVFNLITVFDEFIADAVIPEGHDQPVDDGLSEPQLVRHVLIEEAEDVFPVHALGRGGNAQQKLGLKIADDPAVGLRRRVMALVDDDIIPRMRVERFQGVSHDDVGGKDEIGVLFFVLPIENAVGLIAAEDAGEGLIGFHEDGALVDDVKQPAGIEVQSVEGRQKGFAGTGRGGNEGFACSHGSDAAELFEGPALHVIRLDLRVGDAVVHVPALDGIAEPGLVFADQVQGQGQRPFP